MTKGVLMYCFNTDQVAYHRVADVSISLAKQHLGLPITVVTNAQTLDNWKNPPDANYITIDNEKNNTKLGQPWHNLERCQAMDHSPYDKTIVIDVDYLCFSKKLLQYTETVYDFLIHSAAHDVSYRQALTYERKSMLPLVWATVLVFKKTDRVKRIFDTVKLVKSHYQHFCNLYRIDYRNFRNDYAFAIALNQCNGYHDYEIIPDSIATLPHDCSVLSYDNTGLNYHYQDKINSIEGQDIHVLNKGFFNV
jgi:hypothetical protein